MANQYLYPIQSIWFYLFTIGILIFLATYIWQFRYAMGAKQQAFCQVCKGFWLLFLVLGGMSDSMSEKMFWFKLRLVAGSFLSYFWIMFVWKISNQKKVFPPLVKYFFLVMCGCLCLAIIADSYLEMNLGNGIFLGHTTRIAGDFLYIVGNIVAYLLCVIALSLSGYWISSTSGLRRRQALWFTLSGVFSLSGAVMNSFSGAKGGIALPLGFLISGMFILWGYCRWHFYDVLLFAQKKVLRVVIDGLLVVDEYGYIVDMNPTAQDILEDFPITIGSTVRDLVNFWPELGEEDQAYGNGKEVMRSIRKEPRWYYLRRVPLVNEDDYYLGMVFLFEDINRQKQDQSQIIEQQKVLAILEERNRLSQEIHDGLSQICSSLVLDISLLSSLIKGKNIGEAERLADQLGNMVKGVHLDVRESIAGLQTSKQNKNDFTGTLQKYIEWYEASFAINVSLNFSNEPLDHFVSKTAKVQLLRIIQEALVNIRKHANANWVKISMQPENGKFVVSIQDGGRGFDLSEEPAGHFGLQIMRNRAETAGAQFLIESSLGQGTKITVIFDERG